MLFPVGSTVPTLDLPALVWLRSDIGHASAAATRKSTIMRSTLGCIKASSTSSTTLPGLRPREQSSKSRYSVLESRDSESASHRAKINCHRTPLWRMYGINHDFSCMCMTPNDCTSLRCTPLMRPTSGCVRARRCSVRLSDPAYSFNASGVLVDQLREGRRVPPAPPDQLPVSPSATPPHLPVSSHTPRPPLLFPDLFGAREL
eukprot:279050-Rhodomonas_salina.1